MAGKLWDKGYEPDKMIEEYTVGDDRELDMRLARYDVEGSLAHIAMLETIGLLTAEELEKLTAGLKEIAAEIEAGRFEIEPGTEDVHSQVELMLTRRLGDAGKKIHSGRSRNEGISRCIVLMRYSKSSRNSPFATISGRLRFVAQISRMSTGMGVLLPTRTMLRRWMAVSSLACRW